MGVEEEVVRLCVCVYVCVCERERDREIDGRGEEGGIPGRNSEVSL